MNSIKRGFTLIELLVVIAIIAILAAILFPVFAQAKLAAKSVVALSNTKQLALAVLMYQNDYDDSFPLGTSWNTGNDSLTFGPGKPSFSTWGWDCAPYIKSAGLFQDPTGQPNPSSDSSINFATLYTQFGYNYSFLSPDVPIPNTAFGQITSASASTGQALSQTVLVTSKWTLADNTTSPNDVFSVGGFPVDNLNSDGGGFGMMLDAASEAPNCSYLNNYCGTDWGAGGFFNTPFNPSSPSSIPLASKTEGQLTGGNAFRNGNTITVAWCDGHAKAQNPGTLAGGTNFNINAAAGQTGSGSGGQINITHIANYEWSLSKSCSDFYSNCSQ